MTVDVVVEKRIENAKRYLRLRKKMDKLDFKIDEIKKEMRELHSHFSTPEFEYISRRSREAIK